MEKQHTRAVFARQPARILLVDFSLPFNAGICHLVHKSLEELFAVVCSMPGIPRIPYFGLFALGTHAENLFPLQHIKGNFQRLYNALQELKSFTSDSFMTMESSVNLGQAMREATVQFRRQAQTLRQMTGFSAQLEVTLLTCHQGPSISKQINEILPEMDLTSLRRIQVVTVLAGPSGLIFMDPSTMSIDIDSSPTIKIEMTGSPTSSQSSDPLALGAVETVTLEQDEISFQEFFRSWLHDCGTDREHLHLQLPPTTVEDDWLTLKCDLQESLLSSSQFPFQAQFDIHASMVPSKPIANQMSGKINTITAPIITLHTIQMVKVSGLHVCDSTVFGMPLLVKPTSCWQLDWEELESNQQHFHALCHLLQEKSLALVTRLDDNTPSPSYQTPKPSGHFILLPSSGLSLLLKPIAVKELILPTDCSQQEEQPVSDFLQNVTARLNRLEVADLYNPLMNTSQLHKSLMGTLVRDKGTRPVQSTGRQLKRKTTDTNTPSRMYPTQRCSSYLYPSTHAMPHGNTWGSTKGTSRGVKPPSAQRYHQPLAMESTTCYPHTE
ncbi:meiosis 1 arrest protein-like [Acanthaster planci]|uniref:Meiosis 1 arrest protein-like n=1 Tax=Acanthaster planci TaxID=133434 RepID=A0A8B7ZMW6_ACAPL|nr:meiosis 1 arrest protein-like [Acanthaster planci]